MKFVDYNAAVCFGWDCAAIHFPKCYLVYHEGWSKKCIGMVGICWDAYLKKCKDDSDHILENVGLQDPLSCAQNTRRDMV